MFFGEGIAGAMFCAMSFDCFLTCILTTKSLRGLSEYYDLLQFVWCSMRRCHQRSQSVSKQRHCFPSVLNQYS